MEELPGFAINSFCCLKKKVKKKIWKLINKKLDSSLNALEDPASAFFQSKIMAWLQDTRLWHMAKLLSFFLFF